MILEYPDLTIITGRSRSSLYNDIAEGHFPKPNFKAGPNSVGWNAATVARWMDDHGQGPVTASDLIAIRVQRIEAERRVRLDSRRQRQAEKRQAGKRGRGRQ